MDDGKAPGETRRSHVLVVDDDADISKLIARYLEGNGLRASVAASAGGLQSVLDSEPVDLILLDLGLPDADGSDLLRDLQATWGGPVIVVTGRGEPIDRIAGLESGADDYVTKPFALRELLARVRSVIRRTAHTELPQAVLPASARPARVLEFDGLRLHVAERQLRGRNGGDISLTSGEFDLLHALLDHAGEVCSRDQLMNTIHGRDAGPFDRAIDVRVSRLRHKLETDPAQPQLIKSVRCAGYLLAVPVHRA